MKKILSIILTLIILVSVCSINVAAMPAPGYFGDANYDLSIDVLDATYIQQYLANKQTMTILHKTLGDVDADSEITILDATLIQQKVAGIFRYFPAGIGMYIHIQMSGITANRVSGSVQVNETVTFSVNPTGYCRPFYMDYYVNNELIVGNTTSTSFTYTFEEPGDYRIEVVATNSVGMVTGTQKTFKVHEVYDYDINKA